MVKTMDRVQGSRGQHAMADRIKKSLYYGRTKEAKEVMECPSLPLTEAVVDVFGKALKKSFPENRSLDVFDLNYASNVSEKACISPCSVVLSTIYLDKLKKKNSDYLRTVSPCDVFLVSMMVASKYLFDDGEDEEVFNDEWAASGEIELKELNRKEREFLTAMEWELYVSPDEFFKQLQNLELLVTWNETRRRKFDGLTYNELVSLAFDKNSILKWAQCADGFLKMFAITAITYGAVITSVLGATMIVCSLHLMVAKSIEQSHDMSIPVNQSLIISTGECEPFNPLCSLDNIQLTYSSKKNSSTERRFSPRKLAVQKKVNYSSLLGDWSIKQSSGKGLSSSYIKNHVISAS